jgi:hypothetical protein
MYAALVSLRGYRSTALTEQENRKLLPTVWVRVSRKGFQINNRTYNLGQGKLDPFRGSSGITAQQGRWEVHYSPDHPEVAWLFNHRAEPGTDPWIEVPFIHRRLLRDRWTEETWAEALHIHLAAGGSRRDEAAITRATAQLLRDAAAGPQATTPASKPTPRVTAAPRPALPTPAEPYDDDMPPLDPNSVRPFRSLDRPAGDLFDTPERARGAGQSLEEFLASLPGLHPSGRAPASGGDTDGRPHPEDTCRADSGPASPPPGGPAGEEPDRARQGDGQ